MASDTTTRRGAKPLAPAEPASPQLDGELLEQRNTELAELAEHQRQVVDQFGDGLPWQPEHYENAIRHEMRRGCEAFLRAGRYLIVARECAAHGEWSGILQRLGLGNEQARRMMEAARRVEALPNSSTSRNLLAAADTSGKLVELLALPEEQFKELAVEGETAELNLDDVERMTIRELRAAVRNARQDLDAKDARIGKLSQDLNKAEEQTVQAKRKWREANPNDQLQSLLAEAQSAAFRVRTAIAAGSEDVGLSGALMAAAEHAQQHGLEVASELGGIIVGLLNDLRLVRDHDQIGALVIQDEPLANWQQEA